MLVAVFCGIDWAEDHHDIALVDRDGTLLAKRRIGDDTAGFGTLLQLLAEAGDAPDTPIPVAIETSHGLLMACLRATGRPMFPINPMSVSRYRDRHSVARRKSDAGDAFVPANILRTDPDAHRPLPHEGRQIPITVGAIATRRCAGRRPGATAGTASTWPAWPTSPTVSPTSTRDAGTRDATPPCYAVRWRSADRAMVTSRP